MAKARRVRKSAKSPAGERWVIKAGSSLVCGGGPLLLRSWAQQLASLRRRFGIEVIWVTSGAIASAVDRTDFRGKKRSRLLSEKQALSAIGQPIVMDLYNLSLQASGLLGAQILLTYDDLADPSRCRNFRNTVEQLLEWGAVPILNENDAVSTDEIKFGDNDSLSAKVARVTRADRLLILTDVQGLFEKDPRKFPNARLVRELSRVDEDTLRGIKPAAGTPQGTGGMYSKVLAGREASEAGIETWLIQGDRPGALLSVAEGQAVGTRILPRRR